MPVHGMTFDCSIIRATPAFGPALPCPARLDHQQLALLFTPAALPGRPVPLLPFPATNSPAALALRPGALPPCRKVGKAYFALLDVLCHNHANVIATRDTSERLPASWLPARLVVGLACLGVAHSACLHRRSFRGCNEGGSALLM